MAMTYELGQVLYRVEDRTYTLWGRDLEGEFIGSGLPPQVQVDIIKYRVVSVTPKGAHIQRVLPKMDSSPIKKWVSTHTKFVAPTAELALELAIKRRRYHVKCSRARTALAESRLHALEALDVQEQEEDTARLYNPTPKY